jgi:hypothetical protein
MWQTHLYCATMKARLVKFVHAVVAVLFLAAAAAPACAAQENCSMPCCRPKARPAPAQADAAHAKPCCSPTADPSAGSGVGCRYDQTHLALDAGHAASALAFATPPSVIGQHALELNSSPRAVFAADTPLFNTPIFLRTQTLLI